MIEFLRDNMLWVRPLWFCMGWTAFWILTHTRPKFYEDRSTAFYVACFLVYPIIGPLVMAVALVTMGQEMYIKRKR